MKFVLTESQLEYVISKIEGQLYESLLVEGQNDDRARQIILNSNIDNPDEIFTFLKSIDKSKNNKMLPIIATFYVNTRNDQDYGEIINTFKKIFNQKTIPDATLSADGTISMLGNEFSKNEFYDFKDFFDHYTYEPQTYEEELEKEKKRKEALETELVSVDANLIFENNNFKVYKAIHEKICIQLFGRDNEDRIYPASKNPYCIGWGKLTSPETHLSGYRRSGKTFYAVLDKKKYEEYKKDTSTYPPSMLNIVQIEGGSFSVYDEKDSRDNLYPAFNNTQEYLTYLEQGGINLNILFKDIPYTPPSDELISSLINNPSRDEYFKKMSSFQKRQYAEKTPSLSPKQVKFFVTTGDIATLDTFVKNYTIITDISKEAFSLLPSSQQKSFVRSKLIQLVNGSNNFNEDNFFVYINENSKLTQYAVDFIRSSFAENRNENKDISRKILGLLSPVDMLESFKGQDTIKINYDNFKLNELPENFGEYLTECNELDINGINITKLPESIGLCKNLKVLHITNCNSLNTIPNQIGELIELEDLVISNTAIDDLPDNIGRNVNLTSLMLNSNKLTTVPSGVRNFSELAMIDLSDNEIVTIPYEIFLTEEGMSKVREGNLDLNHGDLRLKSLTFINFDENPLDEQSTSLVEKLIEIEF